MNFDPKKLRSARLESGLSNHRLARELAKVGFDISPQTLNNWESGAYTPNCHELAEIAMFYGKRIMFFFTKKQEGA